ncbi:MAG TPA: cell division protein FtsQ/DivIB [Burkholderiaceae bacterium]
MARNANTANSSALPPDIRVMNGVALLLVLGVVLLGFSFGLAWLMRQPAFNLRSLSVEGDVSRNSLATLRANALPRLAGNFLTMNLQQARAAFEAVPWVRHATVQRVWPMRLRVQLEEHRAAALWEQKAEGADAGSEASVDRQLVNSFGEVFQANLGDVEDELLPTLSGPAGASAQMFAMWQRLDANSRAALDESIERLDLSWRGSWRITLEKGSVVELGRGTDTEVAQRFAQYTGTVTQVASRFHTEVESADLRHSDGYALKLRGVGTEVKTTKKR